MLRFENVSFNTPNKCILNGCSYIFNKGIYILQGESGIGKTTLLNLACGYLTPNTGSVIKKNDSHISYMFQEDMLFHNLTVRENMNIKCNAINLDMEIREKIFEKVCEKFKIYDKIDCLVQFLSGGEKKRVQLAMLAIDDCDIWLLDEPIANLDSQNSEMIMDYLFSQKQKLIIIVSHQYITKKDHEFVLLEMKDGRIYEK